MLFDKSKVYTALNADELKVGSICFFADNLADLRYKVETEYKSCGIKLTKVLNPKYAYRFTSVEGGGDYNLAYLIEEPKELKKRPMTFEEIVAYWKKHRMEIFSYKDDYCTRKGFITGYTERDTDFRITDIWIDYTSLLKNGIKEDGTKFEVEED